MGNFLRIVKKWRTGKISPPVSRSENDSWWNKLLQVCRLWWSWWTRRLYWRSGRRRRRWGRSGNVSWLKLQKLETRGCQWDSPFINFHFICISKQKGNPSRFISDCFLLSQMEEEKKLKKEEAARKKQEQEVCRSDASVLFFFCFSDNQRVHSLIFFYRFRWLNSPRWRSLHVKCSSQKPTSIPNLMKR